MPLNFPTAPTLNQTYTSGTKTWVWNGNGWALSSTLTSLVVTGNITIGNGTITGGTHTFQGNINPRFSNTYTLGNTTNWWNTIWGESVNALYADLAEKYLADAPYEPGTVLMFGGTAEVTLGDVETTRVAGVVSTTPAYLMNHAINGENVVNLALIGRVPCKVSGSVRKGDLMTSVGDGTAHACASPQIGSVIGKALEDHDGPAGVIEVVVGRL